MASSAALVAANATRASPFCDADFPGDFKSIGGHKLGIQDIKWHRPSMFAVGPSLFLPSGLVGTVLQGELGDAWFVAALNVLGAAWPDLLRRVVADDSLASVGAYVFQFYKLGQRVEVLIDDLLPFRVDPPTPVMCASVHGHELWPMLIEKAYAKLHGSYHNLTSGSVTDALADLTGGIASSLLLSDVPREHIADSWLWHDLHRRWRTGTCILAVSSKILYASIEASLGLMPSSTYAVLQMAELADDGTGHPARLVKLSNPWPQQPWLGKWRDGDAKWTPAVLEELGYNAEDDSSFWVTYEELYTKFNKVHFCRMIDDAHHRTLYHGEWTSESAGGPPSTAAWTSNPQYSLAVYDADTRVQVLLQQRDARFAGPKTEAVSAAVAVLAAPAEGKARKFRCYGTTPLSNARDALLELTLQPGQYRVVPFTSEVGRSHTYSLMVYSSGVLAVDSLDGEAPIARELVPDRDPPEMQDPASLPKPTSSVAAARVAVDDTGVVSDETKQLREEHRAHYPMLGESQSLLHRVFHPSRAADLQAAKQHRFFCTMHLQQLASGAAIPAQTTALLYVKVTALTAGRGATTRWPSTGFIYLKGGETLVPMREPPLVVSAMVDQTRSPFFEARVEVWRYNWLINAPLLRQTVRVPVLRDVAQARVRKGSSSRRSAPSRRRRTSNQDAPASRAGSVVPRSRHLHHESFGNLISAEQEVQTVRPTADTNDKRKKVRVRPGQVFEMEDTKSFARVMLQVTIEPRPEW